MYKKFVKRLLDLILALIGSILLIPVFLLVALAIEIDDPGPVIYSQKRVGKDKKLFRMHKFRSMKVNTPELPTHLLSDPEQYITRVGRFLRRTSLDEIPQIWDILLGRCSVIGPRPALWTQDDLVAERDKYGANSVLPGLTGWAQINGRDELEIPVKAKLDGEYVAALNAGHGKGFLMDVKCFFGTVRTVLTHQGFVEGGTGKLHAEKPPRSEKDADGKADEE